MDEIIPRLLIPKPTPELFIHLISCEPETLATTLTKEEMSDIFLNSSHATETDKLWKILKSMFDANKDAYSKFVCELQDSKKENLLHVLARSQSSNKIMKHIIETMLPVQTAKLAFSRNVSNDSPFMILLSKKNEDCLLIWCNIKMWIENHTLDPNVLNFYSPNKSGDTILHLCGKAGFGELLKDICTNNNLHLANLEEILMSESTPLVTIQNEDLMRSIMEISPMWERMTEQAQKVIFHHICRKGFNNMFHIIKSYTRFLPFLKLVMTTDAKNNNSAMIAAIESNDILLLSILSTIYGSNDDDAIDQVLHHKNKSEETLMKLILSHDPKLDVHCRLLNKIEQDYHKKYPDKSLDQCLRENIGPHIVIEKCVQMKENYEQPTNPYLQCLTILVIWLFPFVMFNFDLVTDTLLVGKYFNCTNEYVEIKCEAEVTKIKEDDLANGTCSSDIDFVKKIVKIPKHLSNEACFNYSLGFLLLPIFAYAVEWIYKNQKTVSLRVSSINFTIQFLIFVY